MQIIDDHARVWERVIGTRGYTGKRAVNATTMFNTLFEIAQEEVTEELDQAKLDALEAE